MKLQSLQAIPLSRAVLLTGLAKPVLIDRCIRLIARSFACSLYFLAHIACHFSRSRHGIFDPGKIITVPVIDLTNLALACLLNAASCISQITQFQKIRYFLIRRMRSIIIHSFYNLSPKFLFYIKNRCYEKPIKKLPDKAK